MGCIHSVEDMCNTTQSGAAEFQSFNTVRKAGCILIFHDRLDLLELLFHAFFEGREIMRRFDLIEGRNAKRGVPFDEQRIG